MQLSYYQHHRLFCTVNWCPCVYFRIKLNVCSRLNKKSIYVNVHVSSIFRSPDELEFLLWNPVGSQVTCICASPVSNSGITIIDTSHLIFFKSVWSAYNWRTIFRNGMCQCQFCYHQYEQNSLADFWDNQHLWHTWLSCKFLIWNQY
jgi:hypothetical protein